MIRPSSSNSFSGLAQEGALNSFGVPGAGIYQIAGNDFQVTLRAIAANGKLEVLSRPTILARNNQQAYILVGQQIPIVQNVQFNSVGNPMMAHAPVYPSGKATMFYCGNDTAAKAVVARVLEQFGWEGADMGRAASARVIEPLCQLWCLQGFLSHKWDHTFGILTP